MSDTYCADCALMITEETNPHTVNELEGVTCDRCDSKIALGSTAYVRVTDAVHEIEGVGDDEPPEDAEGESGDGDEDDDDEPDDWEDYGGFVVPDATVPDGTDNDVTITSQGNTTTNASATVKQFTCDCGASFSSVTSLRLHERVYHD